MEFLAPYKNYIVIALVIAAVLLIGMLLFRFLNKSIRGRRGQRLGISEYHEVDKTRRLVLIRRDGVEHLLLIGGNQDLLIEEGIVPNLDQHSTLNEEFLPTPIPMRPPPRPAVFGERRPNLRSVDPSMGPPDQDQR